MASIYRPEETLYNQVMNWKAYIVADPAVLGGKPTINGTRISVEFIIQRLAQGWTETCRPCSPTFRSVLRMDR
jgi:hypothetical protein